MAGVLVLFPFAKISRTPFFQHCSSNASSKKPLLAVEEDRWRQIADHAACICAASCLPIALPAQTFIRDAFSCSAGRHLCCKEGWLGTPPPLTHAQQHKQQSNSDKQCQALLLLPAGVPSRPHRQALTDTLGPLWTGPKTTHSMGGCRCSAACSV